MADLTCKACNATNPTGVDRCERCDASLRPAAMARAVSVYAVVAILLLRALVWGGSPGSLRVLQGPMLDRRFALRRGRTRIGSIADNDVVIDSEVVSRHHAEIRAGLKKIEIEDLRSTNGTLLNGVPIQVSPIQLGDRIRIGDVEMVFEQ